MSDPPVPECSPDTRTLARVRSIGMFLLGFGSLVLAGVTYQMQRRTAERDIELKQSSFEFQTRAEAAKLAASVLPSLSCEDDLRRALALGVLETFLPAAAQGKNMAQLLDEKCPHLASEARSALADYREKLSKQHDESDFETALANAREYLVNGFEGQASRIFYEASMAAPIKGMQSRVDAAALKRAQSDYEQGNFSQAAGEFEKVFSRVP